MEAPLRWIRPETFDTQKPGLGLPQLAGVEHTVIYDPLPCTGHADEGGSGHYESLLHGTYSHHQQVVLIENKFIVYWTNHGRDENGPGQRVLARIGTFDNDRSHIAWDGDGALVELAPQPVPLRRRPERHDPCVICEVRGGAALRLINGRLYVIGKLVAVHGWTNDPAWHGHQGGAVPEACYSDSHDPKAGYRFGVWWSLGMQHVQRWRLADGKLRPDSDMFRMGDYIERVEVTPGRFKNVVPLMEPYAGAKPLAEAPREIQDDVLNGVPVKFERTPVIAPGQNRTAADGKHGLAHHTEFKRPDGAWVCLRDNLLNPGYYYASAKAAHEAPYPPPVPTNYGTAMPVAGELDDGRVWVIGNSSGRRDMFLTLSSDGITFDRTWLVLHSDYQGDGGVCKGGGPQYFQAVIIRDNIWVVYSIGKEQVGVTRLPLASLASA